jgi:Protein of unknown function (DUF2950)
MSRPIGKCLTMALLALAVSLASCSKTQRAAEKSAADQNAPRTFASPAEAGSALFEAAKAGDQNKLLAIFGADGKELLFSGDAVEDKNTRELFVTAYNRMNRWRANKEGGQILYIGADNFPFPIPLKKNAEGKWYFDTAAGKDEVLARRIGNNELVALNVLGDIADAQGIYFNQAHGGARQYAQKFVSDPGQQNGLYWEVAEGQPPSPLGPLGDVAKALGYSRSEKPQPFQGYYYRMLTKQGAGAKGGERDFVKDGKLVGGFAVVAYPAKYGDSGIMSFMVGPDGVVYQKDLGEKTGDTAVAMAEFSPEGWAALTIEPLQRPAGPKSARK